jgi:hypothetical protein
MASARTAWEKLPESSLIEGSRSGVGGIVDPEIERGGRKLA